MHPKPWYDDPDQIAPKLTTLDGLHEVVHTRQQAGEKEELTSLVLLGRVESLPRGGFGILEVTSQNFPFLSAVPSVCGSELFYDATEDGWTGGWTWNTVGELPTSARRCPHCQRGWDLSNFWDIEPAMKIVELTLGRFVGQSIQSIHNLITNEPEGQYEIIQNKAEGYDIRPASVPPYWKLHTTMPKNYMRPHWYAAERAWLNQLVNATPDYVIQPGDHVEAILNQLYHQQCSLDMYILARELCMDKLYLTLPVEMAAVGFTGILCERIPAPAYILTSFKDQTEIGFDDIALKALACCPYLTVITDQGTIGFLMVTNENMAVMDLQPSGLLPKDIHALRQDREPEFACLDFTPGDGRTLKQVHDLLIAKQNKT